MVHPLEYLQAWRVHDELILVFAVSLLVVGGLSLFFVDQWGHHLVLAGCCVLVLAHAARAPPSAAQLILDVAVALFGLV